MAVGILSFYGVDITWHVVTQTRELSGEQKNLIFFFSECAFVERINKVCKLY